MWPFTKRDKQIDFMREAYAEKLYREILPEFKKIIEDALNIINKSVYGKTRFSIRAIINENTFNIGALNDSLITYIAFSYGEEEILIAITQYKKKKPTLIRVKIKNQYTEDYVNEVKSILITKIVENIKRLFSIK